MFLTVPKLWRLSWLTKGWRGKFGLTRVSEASQGLAQCGAGWFVSREGAPRRMVARLVVGISYVTARESLTSWYYPQSNLSTFVTEPCTRHPRMRFPHHPKSTKCWVRICHGHAKGRQLGRSLSSSSKVVLTRDKHSPTRVLFSTGEGPLQPSVTCRGDR